MWTFGVTQFILSYITAAAEGHLCQTFFFLSYPLGIKHEKFR